jgi:hypothetical protein
MLGLTPALVAQFAPINTLAWNPPPSGAPNSFPNSHAPSGSEYGINLNYSFATSRRACPNLS